MKRERGEANTILKTRGMSDSGQAQRFRRTASNLDGIQVDTDYILDSVTVKYDADMQVQIERKLAPRNHPSVALRSRPGKESKAR